MRTGFPRRIRLIAAIPIVLATIQAACSPASQLNTVLNSEVEDAIGQFIDDVVLVRVINQTNNDVQLDILVDGLPQTVTCNTLIQVCDVPFRDCPQEIEAIEQRSLDPQGRFVGGRVFNGNEAFRFSQAEGEIGCRSVIVYKFTEGTAEAFDI